MNLCMIKHLEFLFHVITFILSLQLCTTQASCTGYKVIYMHDVLLPFPMDICAQNGPQSSFKFDSNGDYIEYASTNCNSATITYSGEYQSRSSSISGGMSCDHSWSYLIIYENENILYKYPLITDEECITWVKLKCLPNTNDLEQYYWDDNGCSGEIISHVNLSSAISIFDVSNYTSRTRELQCNVYEAPLLSPMQLGYILAGCGLLLCCILGCFICYKCKKRKQKKRDAYFQQKAVDLNQNVNQYVQQIPINNMVNANNQNVVMVQMPNGQMVTANILPNVVPVNNININQIEPNQQNVNMQQMQEGQPVLQNNEQEYTMQ